MEDLGLLPPSFLSLKEKRERASRKKIDDDYDEEEGFVEDLSRKW